MIKTRELEKQLNQILEIEKFQDYSPNGLQVEANETINKAVFGVTASLDLIEQAIEIKADAIVVHHGYFWKNEKSQITGIKAKRIKALMKNNISLFAYHLPLDAHPLLGNNIQLAKILGFDNPQPIGDSLVWQGEFSGSLNQLAFEIEQKLARKPVVIEAAQNPIENPIENQIERIAWCTGAAQDFLEYLIENEIEVDAYISGEISERTPLIARESNIHYIAAGHHATETLGIKALCQMVAEKFNLECQFINIDNPA